MARRSTAAANAVHTQVVDYVGDSFGARTALAFGAWDSRARRGVLSASVLGEHGDPGKSFYGILARPPQLFAGLAGLSGNPLAYRDGINSLDNNLSDEAMSDPARRIFAERLRRRR